ncbi:MAG: alanine/glycine:cation symporter family protein [Candidatus Latescibacterota bacterium]|nr:alanine/glycine:cation symporter family protein [Candidatus Latescibacterota bacterium]
MRSLYAAVLVLGFAAPSLAQEGESSWVQDRLAGLDSLLGDIVILLGDVLLFDFGTGIPLIVAVLLLGGIYYSFYLGWFSVRAFGHAIDVIRGIYDDPEDPGEISHFKALTSALSATIGLGNIAGVAVAIGTGGPGALVWMMLTAIFGMSSKLASCTLAIMYRTIHPDGHVTGGPMYYLEKGLEAKGLKPLGHTLAVLFAILCIGGALGGGNMFQSNQTLEALGAVSPFFKTYNWLFGLVLAALVGAVVIGGIQRIANVTSRLVPTMCVLYVVSALFIILSNIAEVPAMFALIFSEAFTGRAVEGGVRGVAIIGITRAAFSNEAGIGSAAIAHSAAKTEESAREGIVAMIGPFIDTIVICTMTALVVLLTGVYQDPALQGKGAEMTAAAFSLAIPGAEVVLAIVICLFAYSTMISWEYYGERAWEYLFGSGSLLVFRLLFVAFVFIGAVTQLANVIDFSDLMILSMALPNIIGGIILSPQIKEQLQNYWGRLQRGEMQRYK